MTEPNCENCGAKIGVLEVGRVWKQRAVCDACFFKLDRQTNGAQRAWVSAVLMAAGFLVSVAGVTVGLIVWQSSNGPRGSLIGQVIMIICFYIGAIIFFVGAVAKAVAIGIRESQK